jgi:hypothetical protein
MLDQIYIAHNILTQYITDKKACNLSEDETNIMFCEKFISMQDFRNEISDNSELFLVKITCPIIIGMLQPGPEKEPPAPFDVTYIEFGLTLFASYYQKMKIMEKIISQEKFNNFLKINSYAHRLISFLKILKFSGKHLLSEKIRIEKSTNTVKNRVNDNIDVIKKIITDNITEIYKPGYSCEKLADEIRKVWNKNTKKQTPSHRTFIRWLNTIGINPKNIDQLPEKIRHW